MTTEGFELTKARVFAIAGAVHSIQLESSQLRKQIWIRN